MPRRRSDRLAQHDVSFPNMKRMMEKLDKKPAVGVSQGGSGRKWSGARVAAKAGPDLSRKFKELK